MGGRLEGKVAVVTGGANGIGRACCERFAEEGAAVVVADLLEEPGRAVASSLGDRAAYVAYDASDPSSNEGVMETAVERFGGLDVLVTAAGVSHAAYRSGDDAAEAAFLAEAARALQDPPSAFLDLPLAAWQRVLDVNLTGTFLALQAAARRMVASARGGSIVTLASVAAKHPEAGPVSYGVSKAGVWMLTKQAALALAPAGIRVNAIGPGFIRTNMTRLIDAFAPVKEQVLARIPMRRVGEPREVADTAVFLASDESSYYTGEILHPDGGFYTD
jgi:NAD(P)-dependent dehydrogenase (short-subunit alcohol dehydrogenase family)